MKKTTTLCIGSFFIGALVATLIQSYQNFSPLKKISLEETVLAEMLYDNFQRYAEGCNIDNVSKLLKQIDSTSYKKVEKEKYDNTLLTLIARKKARIEKATLQKAEEFLKTLSENASIYPIIDKKIYIEIIAEGLGDAVSSEDTLLIHLKQSDETGKIIKETSSKEPITLSLPKMDKGFKIGMNGAKIGEKRKIYVHPSYGLTNSRANFSQNHVLIYEVELLSKIK
ncbi:MAG: hypothetical protein FJZ59_03985 [Chlamydiae bacterium]|jgi:peptidylprolyl isomerase|nr:hypothetical protein [Chlamydiota bacterium]